MRIFIIMAMTFFALAACQKDGTSTSTATKGNEIKTPQTSNGAATAQTQGTQAAPAAQSPAVKKPQYDPVYRVVIDNPEEKEVIIHLEDDEKKTTKAQYTSYVIDYTEILEFSIDGKKYKEKPGDVISVMINASGRDYLRQEVVWVNRALSNEGPFLMPTKSFDAKDGSGKISGPYELIKNKMLISGFEMGPEDEIPQNIAPRDNENLHRFHKLIRF